MHIIIIYNYYISNKGLLKECDKEEHVKVTGVATTSCMKCRGPTRIARLSPDDTTRFTLDVGCRSVCHLMSIAACSARRVSQIKKCLYVAKQTGINTQRTAPAWYIPQSTVWRRVFRR